MMRPLASSFSEASARPSISTGKERDSESGNDYFGARYYASAMGRWLSPDWSAKYAPVPYAKLDDPQTLNLYSYVRNNPLTRNDPDGHTDATDALKLEGMAEIACPECTPVIVAAAIITTGAILYQNRDTILGWFSSNSSSSGSRSSSQPQSLSTPATPKPPDDGNNGNKKTEHGEQRAQQAREGDTHREVGDANRVKAEGRMYTDTDTGNTVHVKGNRVVITDSEGNQVTQFKNTRANTAQRVQRGQWIPKPNN
jgi:RHS repeat-associated protein